MKKLLTLLLAAVLLCGSLACQIYDGPPKSDGSTEPPAHTGTFVCDLGKMTFNGDGRTVVIDFSHELAELTGLPEGETEGTYVFYANLVPTRTDYRYDKADELEITAGGVTCKFHNNFGEISESVILLTYYADSGDVELSFVREGA